MDSTDPACKPERGAGKNLGSWRERPTQLSKKVAPKPGGRILVCSHFSRPSVRVDHAWWLAQDVLCGHAADYYNRNKDQVQWQCPIVDLWR
jgi:hypothetical protein